jgi:hypothetical protein
MDDGNIALKNPSEQERNHRRQGLSASAYNDADANRSAYMPEISGKTRRAKTTRSHIWRNHTQA